MARFELKTWPEGFRPIFEGVSSHTIRRMDRPYAVGDILLLREWDPQRDPNARYTGASIVAVITHVTPPGSFWLPDDVCVLSIKKTAWATAGTKRLADVDPVVAS